MSKFPGTSSGTRNFRRDSSDDDEHWENAWRRDLPNTRVGNAIQKQNGFVWNLFSLNFCFDLPRPLVKERGQANLQRNKGQIKRAKCSRIASVGSGQCWRRFAEEFVPNWLFWIITKLEVPSTIC